MAARHVAMIGMLRSGKTTLITSLIDHWLNHDPNMMALKNGHEILCQWKDEFSEGKRAFEVARQKLIEGRWPSKTLKPLSYALLLRLKKERLPREIVLFDIPGERLADADMISCRHLGRWSEHIVHSYANDPTTRADFEEFRTIFHQTHNESEHAAWLSELESAYRCFLAKLIVSQHPLITPSSMLIDGEGNYVPKQVRRNLGALVNWLKTEASLGIGPGKLLFPLPSALLGTAVGKKMQRTFSDYLKQIVWPSLAPLAASEDVVVLTDVAAVLESGPSWKNTISHLYAQIAKFIDPGGITYRALYKSWAWLAYISTVGIYQPRATERVIVVGSQADRIHQDDQNVLRGLVKQLATPAFKHIQFSSGVTLDTLVAAAIVSTVCLPNRVIQYERLQGGVAQQVQKTSTQLPPQFPETWLRKEFRFPVCQPKMPANKTIPPPQRGLRELTEMLLKL